MGKEDKRKTRTAVLAVLGRIHCIREDGECEILCRVDEKSGTAHRKMCIRDRDTGEYHTGRKRFRQQHKRAHC